MLVEVMTLLLREKQPDVVAIEQNDFEHIRQNQQLMTAIRCVHQIVIDANFPLYAFAPSTIRKAVTGDGIASKFIVAKVICAANPFLKPYLHREPGWRQRYYFNMFDAIACGLTYLDAEKDNLLAKYAVTR
jgi:Holliday junction resolvasome RuvABC endonuclease subunit